MIYRAYSTFSHEDVQPITHLEKNHYLMETFHGPTASFKDLSLQLTPKILTAAMEKTGASQNVGLIVATSGDTGTAALHGWGQEKDVPLIVLYPKDGVSVCQDLQMATQEGSVCVLGVDGDFDFCQTTVKDILNDHALMDEFSSILPNLTLSSANSINWGRFLPQVVFTVSAYCDMIKKGHIALGDEIDVCIPTGNFGNILGAVYARSMGVPIKDLICASNDNNVLSDFITSGAYDLRGRDFRKTVSPSIDILISSNVERFLHLLSGQDSDYINSLFADLADHGHFTVSEELRNKIQAHVQGGWCNESECIRTIKAVFDRTQVMIDPHTAVAKNVADQFSAQEPTSTVPMLISSTAHFGKFPDSMLEALHEPAVERTDNIQADVATMFSNLSALEPKNSHHPELVHLLEKPVLHDNAVPADKTVIINTIKNFLTDFAAKNAQ